MVNMELIHLPYNNISWDGYIKLLRDYSLSLYPKNFQNNKGKHRKIELFLMVLSLRINKCFLDFLENRSEQTK